jgi:hypothetical protein
MRRTTALALLVAALCGCQKDKPPATFQSEPHGHSHERDNMKFADVGELYHAGLTAHLSSKEGNELDILFETVSDPPKSAPVPLDRFTAAAKTADGKTHQLEFVSAPKEERPTDPVGLCSHFVAKAPWMKPDDVLSVTMTVVIRDNPYPVEWKNFNPKKYAHHVE